MKGSKAIEHEPTGRTDREAAFLVLSLFPPVKS